jgi:hypothetical protein
MTRSKLVILAAASVAACSLMAQSSSLRVTVPFDFVAGSSSFPAGEYLVQTGYSPNKVVVRSSDAKKNAIMLSHGAQATKPPGKAELVFKVYDDRYFLSQVWTGDAAPGQELPASRAERQQIAARRSAKTVTLAATH